MKQTKKAVLVVVPYRDRDEDLKRFLENAPAFFNQQAWTCDIFLAEMAPGPDWNAGATCNAATKYLDSQQVVDYDYIYIHHVDIFGISGQIPCPDLNHCYMNLGDYGSCFMSIHAFKSVGGYSNNFWSWGGEDNHLYAKLKGHGFVVADITKCPEVTAQFNVERQNHVRKFNGLNYGNGINYIYHRPDDRGLSHPHDILVSEPAFVDRKDHSSQSITIWRSTVKVLHPCPTQSVNPSLLLGYIKGADIRDIRPWLKTASIYAAHNYDIALIVAGDTPESVINEILAYNVIVYRHVPQVNNMFIDRFQAYCDFLEQQAYAYVLHVDVTDAFFQDDPFDQIEWDQPLVFTSEGVTVQEQEWNRKTVTNLYSSRMDIAPILKQDVLCGGVFGGRQEEFMQFCQAIVDEYICLFSMYPDWAGIDQAIILQLVSSGRFKHQIYRPNDSLAVHLHVHFSHEYTEQYGTIRITGNKHVDIVDGANTLVPAIVHQYNRNPVMKEAVVSFLNSYFAPI